MESSKNSIPRPTASIDAERKLLEKMMLEGGDADQYNDRYLEIMNGYDWSTELFSENGKYGLKKWDGTLLLPAEFDNFLMKSHYDLSVGDRVVAQIGEKYGVALMEGENWRWILEPEFDYITYPNSILAVLKNEKWGILDLSTNKYLVPLECDQVYVYSGFIFCNGIGIFRIGDKYGVMNDAGMLTKAIFDEVGDAPEGSVQVRMGDRWGYINEEGLFEEDEELAYYYWEI